MYITDHKPLRVGYSLSAGYLPAPTHGSYIIGLKEHMLNEFMTCGCSRCADVLLPSCLLWPEVPGLLPAGVCHRQVESRLVHRRLVVGLGAQRTAQ